MRVYLKKTVFHKKSQIIFFQSHIFQTCNAESSGEIGALSTWLTLVLNSGNLCLSLKTPLKFYRNGIGMANEFTLIKRNWMEREIWMKTKWLQYGRVGFWCCVHTWVKVFCFMMTLRLSPLTLHGDSIILIIHPWTHRYIFSSFNWLSHVKYTNNIW